jgi:glutathione S-transferase
MSIEIFWSSGSPFSWRVLLALEIKGLPYQSSLIEMSTGQLKSPEYLALNPRGRVPALRDGDYVVYESVAIVAYLDRKYPAVPLFGTTAEEHGLIWRIVSEALCYLDAPMEDFILPLYRGKGAEKEAQVKVAIPLFSGELARMDATLRSTDWLVGGGPSAADIVVFPVVQSLLRAAGKPDAARFDHGLFPFAQRYPGLAAWTQRIEALPNYQRTYPPHWR